LRPAEARLCPQDTSVVDLWPIGQELILGFCLISRNMWAEIDISFILTLSKIEKKRKASFVFRVPSGLLDES
jgi:hypothetical protein